MSIQALYDQWDAEDDDGLDAVLDTLYRQAGKALSRGDTAEVASLLAAARQRSVELQRALG